MSFPTSRPHPLIVVDPHVRIKGRITTLLSRSHKTKKPCQIALTGPLIKSELEELGVSDRNRLTTAAHCEAN